MRPAALPLPLSIGALTAVGLGVYSAVHEPTGRGLLWVGPDAVDDVKWTLAGLAVLLSLVETALGRRATRAGPGDGSLDTARRAIRTTAFALSVPVVFHCVWALGFRDDNWRVLLHSILGCVAYGAFVAWVMSSPGEGRRRTPAPAVDAGQWVVVVGAASAVVMLFTLDGAAPTEPAPDRNPADIAAGAEIFAGNCANCHGATGQGAIGPSLVGVADRYPDAAVQAGVVAAGRGAMPAFGTSLSASEISAVVEYTRGRLG